MWIELFEEESPAAFHRHHSRSYVEAYPQRVKEERERSIQWWRDMVSSANCPWDHWAQEHYAAAIDIWADPIPPAPYVKVNPFLGIYLWVLQKLYDHYQSILYRRLRRQWASEEDR